MRILTIPLVFWMVFGSPVLRQTAQAGNAIIDSPRTGEVLLGVVVVKGSSDISGFESSEISFSFTDDPTGTWFLIAINPQPVADSTLVTWDTTVITDGNYVMRLKINLIDGTTREFLVPDLRVRNYTPVETPTPLPITPEATPIQTSMATLTSFPTPTGLARNPATLAPTDVSSSILYGGVAAILTFIIIGIYLWLRRKST